MEVLAMLGVARSVVCMGDFNVKTTVNEHHHVVFSQLWTTVIQWIKINILSHRMMD